MKPAALLILAILLMRSVVAGEVRVRDDLRRLVERDARSGGKSAPHGARLAPLKKDAFDAVDSAVVVLPNVQVIERKVTNLDVQLAEVEKRQAREEKVSVPTFFDSVLNPAFLGGESAKARATAARHRVEALDWQRILLISLEEAKTPEDKARIKSDIDLLKGVVR